MAHAQTRRTLTAALVTVAIIGILASIAIACTIWDETRAAPVSVELLRFSLQVVLATVVGTLGSLLVAEFNRERAAVDKTLEQQRSAAERKLEEEKQRHRASLDFVREILQRTTTAYLGIKGLRRILRGRCRQNAGQPELHRRTYRWFIDVLNRRQLEIEGIVEELESHPRAFDSAREVIALLKTVENRLRTVVGEYEKKLPEFQQVDWIALKRLPELEVLVSPSDSTIFSGDLPIPFKEEVRDPMGRVRMLLRDELLDSVPDPRPR